jgi:hypothetical protein
MMLINKNVKAFFWIVLIASLGLSAGQSFAARINNGAGDLIINEFMAANGSGLIDEDGDYSDWIELYNRSQHSINLSGWSLTDDPSQPRKWTFPDMTVGGQEYLLVLASGKNRKPDQPSLPLHTNFKLGQGGEFLALYNSLEDRFQPSIASRFPAQLKDVSYGRYGDKLNYGFLASPTPGGANEEALVREGSASGAVVTTAIRHDTPFTLTTTPDIKARVLENKFSTSSPDLARVALPQATFRVVESATTLQLTEIMYNPVGGSDYEFIELKNVGEDALDVSNMFFDEGIKFAFPSGLAPLVPGEVVVLVSNPTRFAERYPGVRIAGSYQGQLSNEGEKISLRDRFGTTLASVEYDDENGWPLSPDGRGDSLRLLNLAGDPNEPRNWRASIDLHGSPGTDSLPTMIAVEQRPREIWTTLAGTLSNLSTECDRIDVAERFEC